MKVSWQDVKTTEVLLNRHCLQIASAFKMGVNHDEVERVNSALRSTDNQPPPVYFMYKDHKPTESGEPCPPTRPVCGAKEGILARISHLVSMILTPVADSINSKIKTECSSTEEMIRGIIDANKEIIGRRKDSSRMEEQLVIISQDVKARLKKQI